MYFPYAEEENHYIDTSFSMKQKKYLEDCTDKDKSEERLLCYCSAADISAGRQIGN